MVMPSILVIFGNSISFIASTSSPSMSTAGCTPIAALPEPASLLEIERTVPARESVRKPMSFESAFAVGGLFGRMLALILFEHQLLTLHERRRFFVGVRYNGRIGDVDAELVGASRPCRKA